MRLLPSKEISKGKSGPQTLVAFEPSSDEVLNYLIPKYIEISIFGALIEAAAAEAKILSGEFGIFEGPITDNEGNVVVAEGQTLTPAEILGVLWFCEGITVD